MSFSETHPELDELLWSGSDDEGGSDAPEAASSEDPELQAAVEQQHHHHHSSAAAPHQQGGLDIAGVSSASHQSSTMRASLDEELDPSAPTPSPPVQVPGGGGFRRGLHHHVSQGHHHHQQQQQQKAYHRLGTSAPIAIPNMSAWRGPADKAAGGRAGDMAGTFIPPHQLSRQDDFTFSFTGASPSATLKRERLRARNAILRSTGFLEPQAGAAIPAAQPPADKGLARTSVQSTLTAALTTIGES